MAMPRCGFGKAEREGGECTWLTEEKGQRIQIVHMDAWGVKPQIGAFFRIGIKVGGCQERDTASAEVWLAVKLDSNG